MPYVGQLMVLRRKLASVQMSVVVDERDQEIVDAAQEQQGAAEDAGGDGAAAQASGATVETASLRQRVRLATIDNFQVRMHSLSRLGPAGVACSLPASLELLLREHDSGEDGCD